MKIKAKVHILGLILLVVVTPRLMSQGIIFDFSYDKSTYLWMDSVWIDNDISDRLHLLLSNNSKATLIKKSLFVDEKDRWQKEANTNLKLSFNKDKRFSWGITANNNYSRLESRRVTLNRIGLHQDLELIENLTLNSLFSFSETSRYQGDNNDIDQGLIQKIKLVYSNGFYDWGKFNIGYNHELNLTQRTPEKSYKFDFGFSNGGTQNAIVFRYSGNYQKNKFFSDLSSFEHVTTQDKYEHLGDLQLSCYPLRDLRISLLSNYSYRRFEYMVQEVQSAGILGRDNLTATFYYDLAAQYPLFGKSNLRIDYIYRFTDEEFGDLFSGQEIQLGEVRLNADIEFGYRDSLTLGATFSVTSYSGKSSTNLFSDRDRVYRLGRMTYGHRFSGFLLMKINGSYQYIHNVYISEQLSSNNNHNEVYLFQPELIWSPSGFLTISQSWIMHANYIYYDYEKYEDSPRNTIYRKASYLARIKIAFTPRLDLFFSYRYRYEDYGQLIYRDQWAQRISWERKGSLPSFECNWRPFNEIEINPGYSYERKHSFDHLAGEEEGGTLLLEKELFKRQKFFINIYYSTGEKSSVEFSFIHRKQESLQFYDEESDVVTINIRRLF